MVKYIYGTKYCYRIKIKRKTIDISARFLFSELKSRINNINNIIDLLDTIDTTKKKKKIYKRIKAYLTHPFYLSLLEATLDSDRLEGEWEANFKW